MKIVLAAFLPFHKLKEEQHTPAHTSCGFPPPHGNTGVQILGILRIQQLSESLFTQNVCLTHAAEKFIHCNLHYHLAVSFRQLFKVTPSPPTTNTIHKRTKGLKLSTRICPSLTTGQTEAIFKNFRKPHALNAPFHQWSNKVLTGLNTGGTRQYTQGTISQRLKQQKQAQKFAQWWKQLPEDEKRDRKILLFPLHQATADRSILRKSLSSGHLAFNLSGRSWNRYDVTQSSQIWANLDIFIQMAITYPCCNADIGTPRSADSEQAVPQQGPHFRWSGPLSTYLAYLNSKQFMQFWVFLRKGKLFHFLFCCRIPVRPGTPFQAWKSVSRIHEVGILMKNPGL